MAEFATKRRVRSIFHHHPCEFSLCSLYRFSSTFRVSVNVVSPEIAGADLRVSIPRWQHLYAVPFLPFYPLLAYAYYVRYDEWLKSEEWTFLACVLLGAGHALSFLVTRWSAKARAWITTHKVRCPVHFVPCRKRLLGSLTRRGGLHSHRRCPPSRSRRNRTPCQTCSLGFRHVFIQLSARHLFCPFQ
jgi:hypothetical protein